MGGVHCPKGGVVGQLDNVLKGTGQGPQTDTSVTLLAHSWFPSLN